MYDSPEIKVLQLSYERMAIINVPWTEDLIDKLKTISPNRLIWTNKKDMPGKFDWVNEIPSVKIIPGLTLDLLDGIKSIETVKCNDIGQEYENNSKYQSLVCTGYQGIYPKKWMNLKYLEIWDLKKCTVLDLADCPLLGSLVLKGRNSIKEIKLNGIDKYERLWLFNCSSLKVVQSSSLMAIDLVQIENCKNLNLDFLKPLAIKSLILCGFGSISIEMNYRPMHVGGSNSKIQLKIT